MTVLRSIRNKNDANEIDNSASNFVDACVFLVKNGAETSKVRYVICYITIFAYRRPEDGVHVVPIISLSPVDHYPIFDWKT